MQCAWWLIDFSFSVLKSDLRDVFYYAYYLLSQCPLLISPMACLHVTLDVSFLHINHQTWRISSILSSMFSLSSFPIISIFPQWVSSICISERAPWHRSSLRSLSFPSFQLLETSQRSYLILPLSTFTANLGANATNKMHMSFPCSNSFLTWACLSAKTAEHHLHVVLLVLLSCFSTSHWTWSLLHSWHHSLFIVFSKRVPFKNTFSAPSTVLGNPWSLGMELFIKEKWHDAK